MKKKGFTLIELLAVIVILAIIALIATPIVMNLIENSRKGAAERTAENYMDAVETAVASERLDGNVLKGTYLINKDGNLCPEVEGSECSKPVKVDMSGDKPNSGTVAIENGIVTTDTTMTIKDYSVVYDSDKGAYVATKVGSNVEEPEYICEKTGEASKTVGAQYTCHLDTDRTFYVLENNESSENISLIMDRNFTDKVVPKTFAWCIDGGSDNRICQNINSTEEGTPLKHIQDTFGDNVTVSFPTKVQITSANNGSTSNLPQWLYDHLDGTPNPESGVYGYWTASPNAGGASSAWRVYFTGHMGNGGVDSSGTYGVRPVITISKTELN